MEILNKKPKAKNSNYHTNKKLNKKEKIYHSLNIPKNYNFQEVIQVSISFNF